MTAARRRGWALVGTVAALAVLWTAAPVSAQDHGGSATPRGRQEAPAPQASTPSSSKDKAKKKEQNVEAESQVVEEHGKKVKVMQFSGLDISGELKSPELLYFLNRLRAEFDRPKLPHRSFIPELVDSTKGQEF